MIKYFSAKKNLSRAIFILATGRKDVRSRLLSAYNTFWVLTEADFPLELQADWRWIINQLTRFGPVYDRGLFLESPAEHTMRRIKGSTGEKIAGKIFEICWLLHNEPKYQ
jgi:hypothetical protein